MCVVCDAGTLLLCNHIIIFIVCVMNNMCATCSLRCVQDVVKAARTTFGVNITDSLHHIMTTNPSPALRKGHFDFARSQESDEENGKAYHCADYSHARKGTKKENVLDDFQTQCGSDGDKHEKI